MAPGLVLPVGLAALCASLWLLGAVVLLGRRERAQVARSLSALQGARVLVAENGTAGMRTRLLDPLVLRLSGVGRRLTPAGALRKMRRKLDLVGNPEGAGVEQLLGRKVLGLLALASGAWIAWPGGGRVLVVLVAAVAGFCIPDLLLKNAGIKRQLVIQKSLPDALDLLTISVEAGLGFDAALSQVARGTDGPLSGELFRLLQEMQIGKSRGEAFRSLSERTDVADLDRFVGAILQADRLGVPIAAVLKEQADEMRLKRSQRAEEQAHKVPVKILFPMVVFLLPCIFVIIIGPGALAIMKTL